MRSIKARYNLARRRLPEKYSSYICFARAVYGQKFSHEIVSKWFGRLIEKDDYSPKDRSAIVRHLKHISKLPVEKGFRL